MTTPAELEAAHRLLDEIVGPAPPLDPSAPTPAELAAHLDVEGKAQARADALTQAELRHPSGEGLIMTASPLQEPGETVVKPGPLTRPNTGRI